MKRSLTLLLASSLVAALTACDYNKTPGKDPQASQDFTDAPKARATETDLDSVSTEQVVKAPIGTGSATDQQTSPDAALDAAPGGPGSPTSTMPTQSAEAQSTTRKE